MLRRNMTGHRRIREEAGALFAEKGADDRLFQRCLDMGYANRKRPLSPAFAAEAAASQPRGELASRTLAMPANTNPLGDIFGGWIMSLMDSAGKMSATT